MNDVQKILGIELEELKNRIIANHVAAGQVASGNTRKSLRVEINNYEGILWGRAPFGTLETGRKAGRTPKGFAGIIRQWMKDKGIHAAPIPYVRQPSDRWQPKYTPQERGDMSLAGAIAHTIRTKGTSLYRSGGRSDIYSNEIPKTENNIVSKLLAIYEAQVESINLNSRQEE